MATQCFLTGGAEITVDRILGNGTIPNMVSWGTGVGVTAPTDTALFTPSPEAAVAGSTSKTTVTTTGDTYEVAATLTSTGAQTITNVMVRDTTSGGRPFMKADFTGMPLSPGDGIAFTIQVQYLNMAA